MRLGQTDGGVEFIDIAAGSNPGVVLPGSPRKQQAGLAVIACFGRNAHRLAQRVLPLG